MGKTVGLNGLPINMSKRYVRLVDAASMFEMDHEKIITYASAVGAICRLPEIMLINVKKMEEYMKHLYKVPGTEKFVKKLFVRAGEGSVLYSICRHRFIEMARAAGAVYKLNDDKGGTVLINLELFDEYMEQFRVEAVEMKHSLWRKEN